MKIGLQSIKGVLPNGESKQFQVGVMSFSNEDCLFDKAVLMGIHKRAEELAANVNKHAANNGERPRSHVELLQNAFIGLISEYAWKHLLNLATIESRISETNFDKSSNQVDLVTSTGKTIEARSSIVRNGIKFAIFSKTPFDIIGPYANEYKPGERGRDYYLRTLFHYSGDLDYFVKNVMESSWHAPFSIYMVGGATWAMMADPKIRILKKLKAGEFANCDSKPTVGNTEYSVIPLPQALDAVGMINLIRADT